ncbi:MAG: D-alanine--D-alanine ligase [Clostridiaceae bacterium]|jgi:D-alanine-D-alanine ligase|nr:D-alanine--D-alanine ligase [Clostridiaceae bacterium]
MNKRKVTVLFGGQSSEHEVSRISAQCVLENIDKERFDVQMIGITRNGEWLKYEGDIKLIGTGEWEHVARGMLLKTNNISNLGESLVSAPTCEDLVSFKDSNNQNIGVDVVFPVLHGPNGEDGSVQGLLQLANVPYVGCDILSSAAGMDKEFSKLVFNNAGIPQADYIKVMRSEIEGSIPFLINQVSEKLGWPCFVKPANAGSSVGVSKVRSPEELEQALKDASKYDTKILIEEFIKGKEIECAVLGNENPIASVVGEIVPSNEFYDYNAKYIDGKSDTIIPADIDSDIAEQVRDYAVRAFKALGCSGLSRVDFFATETGQVILNEINTMPGFTSISMYSKLWEASGISYSDLITRLIDLAFERYGQTSRSYERN